jgi:hypothetical protein
MSKLSFSKELVDAVVRYLAARPYQEVAPLLERMNQEAAPQLAPQAPQPAPEASNESDEAAETA